VRDERLPDILSVRLGIIAMPEPLESELAGVTLESDALPQDFPPGDVRRRPEAPGHLGQAAAVPTHGLHQVDNEGSLLNYELEAGRGEALQTPAPSGSQTAPTATAVGVVGASLQQLLSLLHARHAFIYLPSLLHACTQTFTTSSYTSKPCMHPTRLLPHQ
jgi:hypothetical protein